MSRRVPRDVSAHRRKFRRRQRRHAVSHRLVVECLESRQLLVCDALGSLTGTAFLDLNDDGELSAGEALANVHIDLALDADANGQWDEGSDVSVAKATTDSEGRYRFSSLQPGRYFVVQPSQVVDGHTLSRQISELQVVSTLPGTVVDEFFSATDAPLVASPGESTARVDTAEDALAGQRDLTLTVPETTDESVMRLFTVDDHLRWDGAAGTAEVVWDGVDDVGDGLTPDGLQSFDLTEVLGVSGQAQGVCLQGVTVNDEGVIFRLRVHSDAANSSVATISDVIALTTEDYFVSFGDESSSTVFTVLTGAGADLTRVGAIELEIASQSSNVVGQIDRIAVLGATTAEVNFANIPQEPPLSFVVINSNDSGPGSLRQAILNANRAPGAQTITFQIPTSDPGFGDVDSDLPGGDIGADVFVIRPLTPLPSLSDETGATIIDGVSQVDFTGDLNPLGPEIVLDGTLAGENTSGLTIRSSGNQIKGLTVQAFSAHGILVSGVTSEIASGGRNTVLISNHIGVDATGTRLRGNGQHGVLLDGTMSVQIGSSVAGDRNLIGGNSLDGIHIRGGSTPEVNEGTAQANSVLGNWIGLGHLQSALGNGRDGVRLALRALGNQVGGIGPGAGNRIAYSGNNGISVVDQGSTGNVLRGNLFLANTRIAIDLGDDGPSPNDGLDGDSGPNGLQNFPVLLTAEAQASQVLLSGTMQGEPSRTYTIDVYAAGSGSDGANVSRYLLTTSAATDDRGDASWTADLSGMVIAGELLTATATHADGSTSEFSPRIRVQNQGSIQGVVWNDSNRNGIREDDEAVLTGIPVELINRIGELQITTTDVDGRYRFMDLGTGDYTVRTGIRSGQQTTPAGRFESSNSWNVDPLVRGTTTLDWNGDGSVDIAMVSDLHNSLSIWENDGSGSFTKASEFRLPDRPHAVAAGDLNGDSISDLVVTLVGARPVTSRTDDNIVVYLGQPNGGFLERSLTAGDGPIALLVEDLNNDGLPDIATTNVRAGSVSVLLNLGGGEFAARRDWHVGNTPVALAAGDTNDDGLAELIVANYVDDRVVLLRQHENGFSPPETVSVGTGPNDIRLADLDSDGHLDLVAVFHGRTVSGSGFQANDSAIVRFGEAGGWSAPVRLELAPGAHSDGVRIADLDADGDLDLGVLESELNQLAIFTQTPTHGFVRTQSLPTPESPEWVELAMFDGDGHFDIAAPGLGGTVTLLPFQRGTFAVSIVGDEAVAALDFGLVNIPSQPIASLLDSSPRASQSHPPRAALPVLHPVAPLDSPPTTVASPRVRSALPVSTETNSDVSLFAPPPTDLQQLILALPSSSFPIPFNRCAADTAFIWNQDDDDQLTPLDVVQAINRQDTSTHYRTIRRNT